jgi:uncharacterized protein (DUF2236 family)
LAAGLFPTESELDQLILGPDSVAWRIASDVRLNMVMLYPLLLQVAHPTVSAGVVDHSDFEQRPWERLIRTLDYVNVLIYGGREAAAAGRRLRTLHRHFKGVREHGGRYSALEPEAFAWVHATVLNTYVVGNRHFGHRLKRAELEQFYREYRGLGRLIGVRERDLPASWAGFEEYFARTAETVLERTEALERVLHQVRDAANPLPLPLPGPVWRVMWLPARRAVWLGGVGPVDSAVRRRLGIGWNILDETQFRAIGAALRPLTPVLPAGLRIGGPDQLRNRSEKFRRGPLGAEA